MTFSHLDDAFAELERRADADDSFVGSHEPVHPGRRNPSRTVRGGSPALAGAAIVLAVAAVVVGVGFATSDGSPRVGAAHPPMRTATIPAPASSAPSVAKPSVVPVTDVPPNQAALIARFRSILGGTATFTVDAANSTSSSITGVLTSASGTRGMYELEVDKNVDICGTITTVHVIDGQTSETSTPKPCPKFTTLADGSKLQVDPNFPDGPPDGLMNDAILNRPDGWQISLYTANVQGKYYGAPVLGREPALTVKQVTDIVTSPEWLAK